MTGRCSDVMNYRLNRLTFFFTGERHDVYHYYRYVSQTVETTDNGMMCTVDTRLQHFAVGELVSSMFTLTTIAIVRTLV